MKRIDAVAGIDIGSREVRVVVGNRLDNNQIQIIGVGEAPSQGISKGVITDLEETVTSLSEALERAERMVGGPLSRAVIGVSSAHCRVIESQGVVAVSKPHGEIVAADVARADDQAQAMAAAPNYEILHMLPMYYNVDSTTHVKDPVGMSGIKLEAHAHIILALSSHVKNLTKCLYRTQLELEGLVFSPLATAEVLLTKKQRELGVALVNVGAWTTSVAVFEDDELVHAAVLPIGSDHITGDVAIGLRVALDVAERIKVDQGLISSAIINKRDEIDIAKYASEEMPRTLFPRRHLAEIIEARLDEMGRMIAGEFKKIGRDGKLPAGMVLTGGGAKMSGIVEFFRDAVKLPVFLGATTNLFTPIDKVRDPEYSTALGLVHFASSTDDRRGHTPMQIAQKSFGKLTDWIGRFRR